MLCHAWGGLALPLARLLMRALTPISFDPSRASRLIAPDTMTAPDLDLDGQQAHAKGACVQSTKKYGSLRVKLQKQVRQRPWSRAQAQFASCAAAVALKGPPDPRCHDPRSAVTTPQAAGPNQQFSKGQTSRESSCPAALSARAVGLVAPTLP
jgi:hypothetical protein